MTSGVDFSSLVMASNHDDDDADSAIDDDTPLHYGEVKADVVRYNKPSSWSIRSSKSFSSLGDIFADFGNPAECVEDVSVVMNLVRILYQESLYLLIKKIFFLHFLSVFKIISIYIECLFLFKL